MRRWLVLVALPLAGCAADKVPPRPYVVNVTPIPQAPPPPRPESERYAPGRPAAFGKCMACHTSARGGPNGIGPNLWELSGSPAATRPGYRYSDQLSAASAQGLVWTPETLDSWLTSPRTMIPHTKMVFQGLPDPAERSAIIAYLVRLR